VADNNNLLAILSRWASGQQENFLSDSFVHLLNVLREEDPAAFIFLVEKMTDEMISPPPDSIGDFIVTSQIDTDEGTPDIMIDGPDSYALIEVKDESPVDIDQIDRYSRLVDRNPAQSKCLILLTKHQAPEFDLQVPFRSIRWTQVTDWLNTTSKEIELGPISQYVVQQFLGLLEAKGMSINRVGWEMGPGLTEFMNLKTLLREVMESLSSVRVNTSYGADFSGLAIPESNRLVFHAVIRYANPNLLSFSCNRDRVRIEHQPEWHPINTIDLERILDLGSEEVHFFSRELNSQRTALEEFISSCLDQTDYKAQLQS
jgi:hypothetical protein